MEECHNSTTRCGDDRRVNAIPPFCRVDDVGYPARHEAGVLRRKMLRGTEHDRTKWGFNEAGAFCAGK